MGAVQVMASGSRFWARTMSSDLSRLLARVRMGLFFASLHFKATIGMGSLVRVPPSLSVENKKL